MYGGFLCIFDVSPETSRDNLDLLVLLPVLKAQHRKPPKLDTLEFTLLFISSFAPRQLHTRFTVTA